MVNKRQIVSFSILVLMVQVAIWMPARSFPGFSGGQDSDMCHNEPANAYYNNTYASALTLDGNTTESYWGSSATRGRRQEIPVANASVVVGSTERIEQFVKVVFAQNATHLLMLIAWGDDTINGTTNPYGNIASDGFAICWNINSSDFNRFYTGYMQSPAANEFVDTFVWQPSVNLTSVGGIGGTVQTVGSHSVDYSYNSAGLALDSSQDYTTGVVHGNTSRANEYRMELVRPLVTSDPSDVQFKTDGYYDFTIAVFNQTFGVAHLVSYGHKVWIKAPVSAEQPAGIGLPATIITVSFFTVLGTMAVIIAHKRKKRVAAI